MAVHSVKELIVYKKAYEQAMSFFEAGKMLGAMIKSPGKFLTTRHQTDP